MIYIILILCIIVLDQTAKYLASVYLKPTPSQTVPLIKGVFHLTYAENRGAAFSILQNKRTLFIVVTVMFIIFAVYYLLRHRNENILVKISLSMILSGAIGNLIDRVRFGYVVDFMDFRLINFPIFNIADCGVVIGSILLGYYLIFIAEK
jgi:signal peptidase II